MIDSDAESGCKERNRHFGYLALQVGRITMSRTVFDGRGKGGGYSKAASFPEVLVVRRA